MLSAWLGYSDAHRSHLPPYVEIWLKVSSAIRSNPMPRNTLPSVTIYRHGPGSRPSSALKTKSIRTRRGSSRSADTSIPGLVTAANVNVDCAGGGLGSPKIQDRGRLAPGTHRFSISRRALSSSSGHESQAQGKGLLIPPPPLPSTGLERRSDSARNRVHDRPRTGSLPGRLDSVL